MKYRETTFICSNLITSIVLTDLLSLSLPDAHTELWGLFVTRWWTGLCLKSPEEAPLPPACWQTTHHCSTVHTALSFFISCDGEGKGAGLRGFSVRVCESGENVSCEANREFKIFVLFPYYKCQSVRLHWFWFWLKHNGRRALEILSAGFPGVLFWNM